MRLVLFFSRGMSLDLWWRAGILDRELTLYRALLPHLEAGEASVGVGFDFEHLAATPAGETVVATARVTAVEGKRVKLDFEARDSHETIARGKHVRAVVQKERFKERIQKKG